VAAERTFSLGPADLTTELNFQNRQNVTHLLVARFTGDVGDDLDENDDGVLDERPWTGILDVVGVVISLDRGAFYGTTVVWPVAEFETVHIFRCAPDRVWGAGIPDPGVGEDTPGGANPECGFVQQREDLNGDGNVDGGDLLVMLASWGWCDGPCQADLDGDGSVGITDVLKLLAAMVPAP
jgi:hypothetical protein